MNRRIVAWVSLLAMLFQVAVVPLASGHGFDASAIGCHHLGMVHDWHPDEGCGGSHGSDARHCGATHTCHCVHLAPQATAVHSLAIMAAVPPESTLVDAPRRGPAFRAPIFEFLRPPN